MSNRHFQKLMCVSSSSPRWHSRMRNIFKEKKRSLGKRMHFFEVFVLFLIKKLLLVITITHFGCRVSSPETFRLFPQQPVPCLAEQSSLVCLQLTCIPVVCNTPNTHRAPYYLAHFSWSFPEVYLLNFHDKPRIVFCAVIEKHTLDSLGNLAAGRHIAGFPALSVPSQIKTDHCPPFISENRPWR